MSLAAEIAWNLLPPLTFGTENTVISAILAPAYDVGGDCFDYGASAETTRFALFDAMGHGIQASWLATVAMAAYRRARRDRLDLPETVAAVDAAISTTFSGEKFVTAVFAELEGASGRLHLVPVRSPCPAAAPRRAGGQVPRGGPRAAARPRGSGHRGGRSPRARGLPAALHRRGGRGALRHRRLLSGSSVSRTS